MCFLDLLNILDDTTFVTAGITERNSVTTQSVAQWKNALTKKDFFATKLKGNRVRFISVDNENTVFATIFGRSQGSTGADIRLSDVMSIMNPTSAMSIMCWSGKTCIDEESVCAYASLNSVVKSMSVRKNRFVINVRAKNKMAV